MYLDVETLFWSSSASPVTLTPWVGGGAEIPLPRPTQVSICLNISDFHSADINEGEWAHPGLFHVTFDPSCQGVKIAKNRDYSWTRHMVISPFQGLIQAHILEVVVPLLHCCVYISHFWRYRRVSTPLCSHSRYVYFSGLFWPVPELFICLI